MLEIISTSHLIHPHSRKPIMIWIKTLEIKKINHCISHYKLSWKHSRTKDSFDTIFNKLTTFSNQLAKRLSKTKKLNLKKLLKEIPTSPPEIAHTNNTWIENLGLTVNDKEIILSHQDLHDGIIGADINLIQRQFPILVIQSPSFYFASGFEDCPYETIQRIHSNAHHWMLLSLFNEEVKIFHNLNTDPTIETLQQIIQLFSPDSIFL